VQTVGIPRAKPDLLPLLFGEAIAATPAADGGLNRPWFKQKWHAIEAKVRASGIWGCDPEKHKGGIRVGWIRRSDHPDPPPRSLWLMFR
jgi:hypothetical protein